MARINIIIIVTIVCLGMLLIYLTAENFSLNDSLRDIDKMKNKEFVLKLNRNKELIKKELSLQYQKDTALFRKTAQDLASEKEKNKIPRTTP